MAFILLIAGIVMVVAAVRNTVEELIALVGADFTGPGNFVYWIVALIVVGAIGYVEKLKPISDGLLVLILLALFLTKGNPKMPGGGFFQQFLAAVKGTNTATATTGTATGAPTIGLPGGASISL